MGVAGEKRRGGESVPLINRIIPKILCRSTLRAISNNYVNNSIIGKRACKSTTLRFRGSVDFYG